MCGRVEVRAVADRQEEERRGSGVAAAFHWLGRRGVLYPDHYAWFVLFSALDVMLTWLVLSWGWREVGPWPPHARRRGAGSSGPPTLSIENVCERSGPGVG